MKHRARFPLQGKLLTAEQSVRLAIIDSTEREQMIAVIVAHLRRANSDRMGLGSASPRCTPREWYAMPI